MKVSHEVPIALLEKSKKFNDYDYCLLHLTHESEEYRNFYKNSQREVLLDNSVFELGKALTIDDVAKGVMDIKPTWYVIPDCLDNYMETTNNFLTFTSKYPNLPGGKIGVVQGSTFEELIECYKFMSKYADKIALSFDCAGYGKPPYAFTANVPDEEALLTYIGRRHFIEYLVYHNIWNHNKPHHLLGCQYAFEFKTPLYHKLNIETIDTSNPIMLGLARCEKYNDCFTNSKPAIKLYTQIYKNINEEQLDAIYYNILKFKEMCK